MSDPSLGSVLGALASEFDRTAVQPIREKMKKDMPNLSSMIENTSEAVRVYDQIILCAILIAGFSSQMTLHLTLSEAESCPFFGITNVLTSATAVVCTLILGTLRFLSEKLSGRFKVDFLKDTRYFGAVGFLLYITAVPCFLLSFIAKLDCNMGDSDSTFARLLIAILAIVLALGMITVMCVYYTYHPGMFGFIICYYFTPLLPVAALIFPGHFEELGTVSVSGRPGPSAVSPGGGFEDSPSRSRRRVPNDEAL